MAKKGVKNDLGFWLGWGIIQSQKRKCWFEGKSSALDMLSLKCLCYTQIKRPEAGGMHKFDVLERGVNSRYRCHQHTGGKWSYRSDSVERGKQNSNIHEPGNKREL